MNMTPELVTREAVDAALIAIQTYAHNPSERAKVEIALAAALTVLLGEPVAWTEKDGDQWVVYDANSEIGQHILHYQKDMHFIRIFPIFSFAIPETLNAHP